MSPPDILPDWLRPGLAITKADEKRLAELCSNWVKLHSSFSEMSELDVLKAIVLEYRTHARPLIIGRLKNRFDRMRSTRENIDMTRIRIARNA